MDEYIPKYYMLPIFHIIKGNLGEHSNEPLNIDIINKLSSNITEDLESFLHKDPHFEINL